MEPTQNNDPIKLPRLKEWWVFFVWYSKKALQICLVLFLFMFAIDAYRGFPTWYTYPFDYVLIFFMPLFLAYIFFGIIFFKGFIATCMIAGSEGYEEKMPDLWGYIAVLAGIIGLKFLIDLI
jgi:hypothetical protein